MALDDETGRPRHVHVRTRCDICDEDVLAQEQYMALVGNATSTAYRTSIMGPPPESNADNNSPSHQQWHLCKAISCMACDDSPPACTVHADCLRLFLRHCPAPDALDRLWLAGLWARQPWGGMVVPPFNLIASSSPLSSLAFFRCAHRCGLPPQLLRALPLELLSVIRVFSRPHFFWRCVAAVDLAQQLSGEASHSKSLKSFPLSRVASWARGDMPVVVADGVDDSQLLPIIRLTIDSGGLRKLERLTERPSFAPRRFDDLVFIVEERRHFGNAAAHFKNGLLHLALPNMAPGLQIWDTPTPPDLDKSLVRPERTAACLRFHTINLAEVTGITFLVYSGKIMEIHAHSTHLPSAEVTFNRLGDRCRPRVAWIYVPLPRHDPLTHFGCLVIRPPESTEGYFATNHSCFLMRTLLAGETVVGRHYNSVGGEGQFVLSDERPTTLVYSTGRLRPISLVLPFSNPRGDSVQQTGRLVEPSGYPRLQEFPYPVWHFSSAALDNVSRVRVFYEDDGAHCRGLLLEYANGGQRALGQCRLMVDRSKTYSRPSWMAFANVTVTRLLGSETQTLEVTKVNFDDDVPRVDDRRWVRFALTGTLRFWFTWEESRLEMSEGIELKA